MNSSYLKWFIGVTLLLLLAKLGLRTKEEPQRVPTVAEIPRSAPANPRLPASKPQVLKIDLSERLIDELEYDWNSLSAQAEAVREIRGWRFTRVRAESAFHRAGFRKGDLITEDFLTALRSQDSAANLAYRIELILNRITR